MFNCSDCLKVNCFTIHIGAWMLRKSFLNLISFFFLQVDYQKILFCLEMLFSMERRGALTVVEL